MVDKKDKNYCALILEENGFVGYNKFFRKAFKDKYIYVEFYRNITVTFHLSSKDYAEKSNIADPSVKFHFNGMIELLPLVMRNLDYIYDRLVLIDKKFNKPNGKEDWLKHSNYKCFVYLEDENHAIFSRIFTASKLHVYKSFFSTEKGFVDRNED